MLFLLRGAKLKFGKLKAEIVCREKTHKYQKHFTGDNRENGEKTFCHEKTQDTRKTDQMFFTRMKRRKQSGVEPLIFADGTLTFEENI